MSRPVALLTALALAVLALPAVASAQSQTRGSTLQNTPFPANQGNDCDAYFTIDANGGFAAVRNPFGATSCSYLQGFAYGTNPDTDTRTGFVPGNGTITSVTVRSGPKPAPLQFVILRQLTNLQNGAVSGEPKCCFWVSETAPVQPDPDTTTTFQVNLPVENNRTTNVATQDAIGFSAPVGGTLPLALGPNASAARYTPGDVTSTSFHPRVNQQQHGVGTGGAIGSGQQGGIDVLLQYTWTPTPTGAAPPPVTPVITDPVLILQPTDITTIGGSVLRPIGGALDVVLDCLQPTCAATVNVLSRRPVAAAKKKIRSLGKARFTVKQGKGRKVRITLNKTGRRLARNRSTPVTVVVDYGGQIGSTTKNLTLKRAKAKKRKKG